ncbi:hypothetical protein PTKIN_Ptkin11bG0030500 [Pterospermum kingtungense]
MEHEDQINQTIDPKYECLLFDVDDTLYPLASGLSREITKNIQGIVTVFLEGSQYFEQIVSFLLKFFTFFLCPFLEYMIEKLGIDEEKVPELCVSLYKHYGTTMAGLKAIGYSFDYDDFHGFVHGRLPYTMLKPDPVLRNLLLSLPVRKVIFTNADKNHAARVLNSLGLEDCFDGIICFETLNPTNEDDSSANVVVSNAGKFDIDSCNACPDSELQLPTTPVICKPFEKAFEQVFEVANINPQKTVFFDDSIRNIQTGKNMGLHTVWVSY